MTSTIVHTVDVTAYASAMAAVAVVEAAATGLAAPHVGPKEIETARAINGKMEESLEQFDLVSFSALDQELHEALYLPCPNRYLLSLLQREWSRLHSIRSSTYASVADRARPAVAEHTALIDLIAAGASAEEIEEHAKAHRMRTVHRLLEHGDSERERSDVL
jgi:DNA-binding GntR family transcriptional regulator